MKNGLDRFDRRILEFIQQDSSLGPSELSARVHLSISQCSRRLQRLKDEGFVARSVAILDPLRLNLRTSAYVAIRLRSQSAEAEREFLDRIKGLPEIVSCDYTTGEFDFILKVFTVDLEAYSTFISEKLRAEVVDTIRTFIIMKELKNTTALSVEHC